MAGLDRRMGMLTCFVYRRKLGAYVDGELTDFTGGRIARHLSGCSACRRTADGLARLRGLLRAQAVAAEPDWTGLWPGIVRGIEAERLAPARTPGARRQRGRLAVAGACVAGLAAVTLWSLPGQMRSEREHFVEVADTEYPDGVMVYTPPGSDMTVIWIFSPDASTSTAI